MYRIGGDNWDNWADLDTHFAQAAEMAAAGLIGAPGLQGRSWPDCDIIMLGCIAATSREHRNDLPSAAPRACLTSPLLCVSQHGLQMAPGATRAT